MVYAILMAGTSPEHVNIFMVLAETSPEHVDIVRWLGKTHGLDDCGTTIREGDLTDVWLYTDDREAAKAAVKALTRLKGTGARIWR